MILEVKGLHCHYGPVHAVKGMDFAVDQGEAVALIGANGAGKTTTLRAIVGTLRPSGGSVRLDGQDLVEGSARIARVGRGMAYVPEGRQILPTFSVEENLMLGAFHRLGKEPAAAIQQTLDRGLRAVPGDRATPEAVCRLHQRRRAADPGDRSGIDGQAAAPAPRRAVDGSFAETHHVRGGEPDDPPGDRAGDGPRRAEREPRPSSSRTARSSWRPGIPRCRAPPMSSGRTMRSGRSTWDSRRLPHPTRRLDRATGAGSDRDLTHERRREAATT